MKFLSSQIVNGSDEAAMNVDIPPPERVDPIQPDEHLVGQDNSIVTGRPLMNSTISMSVRLNGMWRRESA